MTTLQFINQIKFEGEIFKFIEIKKNVFAPQYFISNYGRVIRGAGIVGKHTGFSYALPKFATINTHSGGYKTINIKNGEDKKQYYVHRLVANAFIKNDNNCPQINHINGNKADNRAINLEWVTAKENINHAMDTGLNNSGSIVLNTENGIFYKSAREASDAYLVNYSTLRNYLQGRYKNKTPLIYV